MNVLLRLAPLLLLAAAPPKPPATGLVPLSCEGQTRTVGPGLDAAPQPEARTYVIDEPRRTLLILGSRTGGFRPLCERGPDCRIDHGPLAITIGYDTARSYELLTLDRTTGALTHAEARKDAAVSLFEARCTLTTMPKPPPALF